MDQNENRASRWTTDPGAIPGEPYDYLDIPIERQPFCACNFDSFIAAMWLMYARAPGRETAPGEPVDLGEIGSTPEKSWERLTLLQLGEDAR